MLFSSFFRACSCHLALAFEGKKCNWWLARKIHFKSCILFFFIGKEL